MSKIISKGYTSGTGVACFGFKLMEEQLQTVKLTHFSFIQVLVVIWAIRNFNDKEFLLYSLSCIIVYIVRL